MRKQKEKTAVEKAVEELFEGGIDSTAILCQCRMLLKSKSLPILHESVVE